MRRGIPAGPLGPQLRKYPLCSLVRARSSCWRAPSLRPDARILLCPGPTLSRVLQAPCSASTLGPFLQPLPCPASPSQSQGWAGLSHPLQVSRQALLTPSGQRSVWASSAPWVWSLWQSGAHTPRCLLWAHGANSRVRPMPGKVCVPLSRPDGVVPAWGTSGCPQGPLDAVLRGQSSGSGLGLSWERRLHAGSSWSPSSRLQEAPGLAALCCVQGAGAFHPHPRPSAGCLLLGTNIDQPVWKGSFLAGTPGGCQLGAGGKGLWVGWETQAAAAVH